MGSDNTSFYDYLIIGQGLAGSLLGWNLRQRGKRILLVDNRHRSSSTKVAAGLINPMAGMRFNLPPLIDQWLAAANDTYATLERTCNLKLHHSIPMIRLFRSPEQIRFWQRQADSERAKPYLDSRFEPGQSGESIHDSYGGFLQKETGYVNLPRLLECLATLFKSKRFLIEEEFQYQELELHNGNVHWRGHLAREVVFCEGYRGQENPWFNYLPFTPDKGEFLTLTGGTGPASIINGAHMAVPLAEGGFRFGSTHNHSVQDNQATSEGRNALLEGLREMFVSVEGIEVTDHNAGVRPATRDRHPFLGSHPNLPNVHLFNGFGARGTLTIPWYAQVFSDYLTGQKTLPAEASIKRFV